MTLEEQQGEPLPEDEREPFTCDACGQRGLYFTTGDKALRCMLCGAFDEADEDDLVRNCDDCGAVASLEWVDCQTALCGMCITKREQLEAEQEKRREEREERIEAAWLAAGGICSKRPYQYRRSGSRACALQLGMLTQLCDCQVCPDCGQPHNTGREEYAEDEQAVHFHADGPVCDACGERYVVDVAGPR